ncbi:hypothetical protein BSL78_14757 [Apostichopus japonicus]|uniref:Integrase zinc-binding domain-containing protein n=1 Tax=Stichopus japonicus TaxID=307972 RepID=A0A2G8KK24_STIJA|nr:hypothetical protein BSL78_14757 [Apostichopus japonicus]
MFCTPVEMSRARSIIIRFVEQEIYLEEVTCIIKGRPISNDSPIIKLNPVLDKDGVLSVGGCLPLEYLTQPGKHPVVIPRSNHIAVLIVWHYHQQVAHRGRYITEGAIRTAGYWIVGSKGLVSAIIHKCVICHRLRGTLQTLKMADLPADRVNPGLPFTSVGLDVFGPWNIVTRRTRGGSADSKRWFVLVTCMSTRAVHIEVLESLSASSLINALRRLFPICGPAKLLRSYKGTNFVGACKELNLNADKPDVLNYLRGKGCTWIFNPPHS